MIRSACAWVSSVLWAVPLLLAGLMLPATPALAACADPQTCTCTISTSGIVFGTYNQQQVTPLDSVGTITTSCSSQDAGRSTYTIALSAGGSANTSQRAMGAGGAGELLYNLYTNVTRSTVWGDGSGSGVSVDLAFPPTNAAQNISVYGRIPARQNVTPGYYTDVITVTITY